MLDMTISILKDVESFNDLLVVNNLSCISGINYLNLIDQ